MGRLAEAVVGEVGTEVVVERVVRGAVGEEFEVEAGRERPDVDPTTRTGIGFGVGIRMGR